MTPEQQRIAIAEACGWSDIVRGHGTAPLDPMMDDRQVGMPVPDYLNDLNAMHAAACTLQPIHRIEFIQILGLDVLRLCPLAGDLWMAQELDCWVMAFATAAQRAEAFLRTINKWTDNERIQNETKP